MLLVAILRVLWFIFILWNHLWWCADWPTSSFYSSPMVFSDYWWIDYWFLMERYWSKYYFQLLSSQLFFLFSFHNHIPWRYFISFSISQQFHHAIYCKLHHKKQCSNIMRRKMDAYWSDMIYCTQLTQNIRELRWNES